MICLRVIGHQYNVRTISDGLVETRIAVNVKVIYQHKSLEALLILRYHVIQFGGAACPSGPDVAEGGHDGSCFAFSYGNLKWL